MHFSQRHHIVEIWKEKANLAAFGGSTAVGRGNESIIIPADPLCGVGQSSTLSVQRRSHQNSEVLGPESGMSSLIDLTSSPVCTEKCSRAMTGVASPCAAFKAKIVRYSPNHQL